MFTKDGIHILINVVICDSTCVDLFLWSCTTQKFIASNVTQIKEKNYYNQHPINQFFLSLTEILDVYKNMLMCCYMIMPMWFKVSKG
jgi:hypothetical protein